MRLELFDTIDKTIDILKDNREWYDGLRKEIKFSLLDALKDTDYVLTIASRVKTTDSLKEKLIRNRLYLKYDSPQAIIDNLSDVIGLKIECRFIDEEFLAYQHIKKMFTLKNDETGYYYNTKYPNILLDLDANQPQMQRNGFSIYRVDGIYINGKNDVRFELQIKSMVNSFWGDIEHKLVYKNTNYYVFDDFMKNLLGSIKANLTIIDRQLHIIFNEMDSGPNKNMQSFNERLSVELVVSKAINDLFAEKLRDSIGFSINLKDTSNILAHYLIKKDFRNVENEDDIAMNLLTLFKKIEDEDISFQDELVFDINFDDNTPFVKTMGEYLHEVLNKDFSWYIFFKILFNIEPGNDSEDFELFVRVYRSYLINDDEYNQTFKRLKAADAKKVRDELLVMLANTLINVGTISIIENESLEKVKDVFNNYVAELEGRVIDYRDFEHFAGIYYEKLCEQINTIF